MKTKNIRSLRKLINPFNPVAGKKQVIVKNLLSFVLFSVFLSGHSYAGTWQDTFNGDKLKGWKRTAEHNFWNAKWEVVEGLLFSRLQTLGAEQCEKNTADFLHWNAHQLKFDRLEVIGTEIDYPQEGPNGMGELCLFLGKKLHNVDSAVEGYIFSPEETSKVTFSEKDGYSRGKTKAWYGNKFPFTTQHLKVVFVSGEFHLFTNGVLLTQFADNHFLEIDVVGLLITCHFGGQWFGANISSFSVSGNGIPNRNLAVQLDSTQLTTIWGALKKF